MSISSALLELVSYYILYVYAHDVQNQIRTCTYTNVSYISCISYIGPYIHTYIHTYMLTCLHILIDIRTYIRNYMGLGLGQKLRDACQRLHASMSSMDLPIYVHASIQLFFFLISLYLPIYLSIYLPTYVYAICLSICLCIYLSLPVPIYQSINQ